MQAKGGGLYEGKVEHTNILVHSLTQSSLCPWEQKATKRLQVQHLISI